MTRFDSVRVHAIILTKDRTDVLQRSVDTAVMKLKRYDVLTVLDDSIAGVGSGECQTTHRCGPKVTSRGHAPRASPII